MRTRFVQARYARPMARASPRPVPRLLAFSSSEFAGNFFTKNQLIGAMAHPPGPRRGTDFYTDLDSHGKNILATHSLVRLPPDTTGRRQH